MGEREEWFRGELDRTPVVWLLDYLDNARLASASPELVIERLQPILDGRLLEPLVEYVAERLHLTEGERRVTFEFSNGGLRRTRFAHEPVGNTELEELARVR